MVKPASGRPVLLAAIKSFTVCLRLQGRVFVRPEDHTALPIAPTFLHKATV